MERIPVETALELLDSESSLASVYRGFESRPEQSAMMRDVLDAYNRNQIALIEAGTGTGKSMAYLIPAMLWAASTGERTVISTNTINLQEQLLNKDIPTIAKALGTPIKAVLIKGMGNYLCLRKLDEAKERAWLLPEEEAETVQRLDAWSAETADGSRSGLPMVLKSEAWEQVCAEFDTCTRVKCPHYTRCFFFKARKEAAEAHLLIVNHHLLFADLTMRASQDPGKKDAGVLPPYTKVIIDEAHNIEDIATDYFSSKVSELEVRKLLNRLAAEKSHEGIGKLPALKQVLANIFSKTPPDSIAGLITRLTIDLPGMRNDLTQLLHNTFSGFTSFISLLKPHAGEETENKRFESKLRLLEAHLKHPIWVQDIQPRVKELSEAIHRYAAAVEGVEVDLAALQHEKFDEATRAMRFELKMLVERLRVAGSVIHDFAMSPPSAERVRWMEAVLNKAFNQVQLIDAHLDISKPLADHLFNKFSTVILCSATLAANKQFAFMRKRLGLSKELIGNRFVAEKIYDSPFNYGQQALFAIPSDMPLPDHVSFLDHACEKIWQAVEASRGNVFVLFTSYGMLQACCTKLEKRLAEHRYPLLKQGDEARNKLLARFKELERPVLFGTDSFWEGVDVAGDALRCVVIVKLPFRVPSEPMVQARSEAIAANGGSPFFDYSLPLAIVKFKQGFGRLIRHKNDRGCVICLDTRLIHKAYKAQFFNSLPACQRAFPEGIALFDLMRDFYKKTYHLAQKQK